MKNLSKWQVMPLLFGSGLCALVYQTVWIRELRLVFGASTLAISAVMAIFLGGIGFGSIYLGRYAEKHRLPLKLYGQLEIAITITAAISPLLISLVRFVYIATGGSLAMGSFFSTIFRLILSILVIGGPTFLMGGTLPAMARAFETESDSNRSRLGLLYGINTIGAVFGVILATFFLLEMLGTVATLWATCLLNLLVGGAALLLARKSEPIPVEPAASKVSARSLTLGEISENKEGLLILGVAAFSGFIFLLMELVWYRMLTPLLGGTTYSFGMILAVALLGIGTGGWLYALRRQDTPVGLIGLAVLCVLEATSIAIPFALGDNIALWSILLQSFGIYGFTGNIIWWFIITSIVVLPSAMISGYLFPMLVGLRGDGRNKVAIQTGQVYAWNTVGVIIGSLVGGFYLMPVLGATGCWQMSVVILAILAFGLLCLSFRGKEKGILYYSLPIALIVCSLTLINTKGPTSVWRHSGIGAHRVNFPLEDGLSSYNSVLSWKNEIRSNIVYEIDGKESSIAIGNEDGFTFVINGKTDGNAYLDAATQVMAPMVGAIIHPYLPKKSMVIGVGTGSSSGWLASIPSMVRVDQVELEPSILKVAEYCAPVNNNVMKNPKVRTIIGDGREVLLTSKEKYDLIFSEPSTP
ncbi:MAG: fused MFS/spermidine synthase, partial [Thermodesulfobacteriota bacterium]